MYSIKSLLVCLEDNLENNFLQLNSDKTEVIICCPPKAKCTVVQHLGHLTPSVKLYARNLSFILDSEFCLDKQISSVVKKNSSE